MTAEPVDPRTAAATSAQLREVLGEVERGELSADRDQVAYLQGVVEALDLLAGAVSKS